LGYLLPNDKLRAYSATHFGRKDIVIKNFEFMASELAFGALYVWMQEVPYTKGAIPDSQ